MKVFFVKDFDDRPYGLLHLAGTSAELWTDTAMIAIQRGKAVRYEERSKVRKDEPQAESKTKPQSSGAVKATKSEAGKKKEK